jgi:hypothetical protein
MNEAGESCFPSIKLLCEETGLSNRAVITHLHNATELGWITVGLHGYAGQRWASHEYRPAWPHHLRSAATELEKAVNVVHDLNKKAVNVIQKVVNVIPKGSEPSDIKAVNEVHTSTPVSTLISNPKSNPHTEEQLSCVSQISKAAAAGSCCRSLIQRGIQGCNPSHPTLLVLIQSGATEDEFRQAAKTAIEKGKPNFSYVVGIVKRQREEAAKLVLHQGRMPTKQDLLDHENKESTLRAKARLFGSPTEKDVTNETTRL